ncbi:MAG: HAD family phosphatase [Clostridiales bacterium]|nr:HAD family phosphatase [Clostridiales bacterium]
MYKNIIFDIGNVLLSFEPKEYMKTKIKIREENIEKLFNEIFLSEEWLMLDRGTIEEPMAIERIIERNAELSEDIKTVFKDWYSILVPIPKTVELLKSLKSKGYNIYYLSNFHDLAFKDVTNKNEFFNLFDGGVVSYEEKLLKPEEEIYKRLIERYNLIPEETIFVDDTKVNVEAAKKLGIRAFVFESPEKFEEDLRKLNI